MEEEDAKVCLLLSSAQINRRRVHAPPTSEARRREDCEAVAVKKSA